MFLPNSHHVGVHDASLVQPSHAADVAVPILDVTQLGAGSVLSLNVDHVVGNGDDHVLSIGDDGAIGVSIVDVAVSAVPILGVALKRNDGGYQRIDGGATWSFNFNFQGVAENS